MSSTYQGTAQVAFSPDSKYDLVSELSFAQYTIILTEISAGTFEATLTGSTPEVLPDWYMRIVLPDGSEHAGRVTSAMGSRIAFLGNIQS